MQIPLIKGDKAGSETDYRDSLPVNMYAVLKPVYGANGYMIQQPGLTQYATGEGVDRGGIYNERFEGHYRVSGTSLISITSEGITSTLGAISGGDTVSLPYSFNTQGIVANSRFYLYDPGAGFREVTDSDLGDPIDCVWVDGYYFFTDGEFIYHTDIDDESAIDPLKFATAEFMPDKSLGVAKTQDNKVIVFGRYSTEYFRNAAADNFAFTRLSDRSQKIGIVGTHCKVEVGSRFYLLGGRKGEGVSVHSLGVGNAAKVATREVDKIIGEYTETQLASSVLETRQEDGYRFLITHLPNHTLMFNETLAEAQGITQAWTILKSDVLGDNQWRAKHGVFEPRKGEWVYGDKMGDTIGVLDNTVATHYGDISEWLLFSPFIPLESASVDELDIQTAPGHTTTEDATVFISLTYNGVTYGKEWTQLYGLPSDYGQRFLIRRLGYIREWFGFKLRGASRSRMAFSMARIKYG